MNLVDKLIKKEIIFDKEYDLFGSKLKYTLAYDENHEIFAWFYALDRLGVMFIEKYYEDNGLNKFDIHVHNKDIRTRSPEMKALLGKKICVLDGKLVTYDVVVKHAETNKVEGYKPGKLKKTLNIFTTK